MTKPEIRKDGERQTSRRAGQISHLTKKQQGRRGQVTKSEDRMTNQFRNPNDEWRRTRLRPSAPGLWRGRRQSGPASSFRLSPVGLRRDPRSRPAVSIPARRDSSLPLKRVDGNACRRESEKRKPCCDPRIPLLDFLLSRPHILQPFLQGSNFLVEVVRCRRGFVCGGRSAMLQA